MARLFYVLLNTTCWKHPSAANGVPVPKHTASRPKNQSLPLRQVHPDTCTGTTLIWNYDEVMRIVQGAGNVVATLSGHAHAVRADPMAMLPAPPAFL